MIQYLFQSWNIQITKKSRNLLSLKNKLSINYFKILYSKTWRFKKIWALRTDSNIKL